MLVNVFQRKAVLYAFARVCVFRKKSVFEHGESKRSEKVPYNFKAIDSFLASRLSLLPFLLGSFINLTTSTKSLMI